jgi:hypothetical protein
MKLTRCWGTIAPGRTLFVAMAYHGNDRDLHPGFWARFESVPARGHRIVHRNHYANPRPAPYVFEMIAAATAEISNGLPDLVIDPGFDALPAEILSRFDRTVTANALLPESWRGPLLADATSYDHLVIVYTDALGLGCEQVEAQALSRKFPVLIINGRRRAFHLDGSVRGQLQISRFLAHTRIAERLMAAVLRRVGTLLAMADR